MGNQNLKSQNNSYQEGFTLLELVMVLSIIILMSTLVIPYITQNIDASAALREKCRLISWMRWAQSQAIKEHRPYRIVFDFSGHAYTVQRYNGGAFDDIETVTLREGITLQNPVSGGFPADILEYDQFGAPVPSGGGIYIRNINHQVVAISVNDITGASTLQSY